MSTSQASHARRNANSTSEYEIAVRQSIEPLNNRLGALHAQAMSHNILDQGLNRAIDEFRHELSKQATTHDEAVTEIENTLAQMLDEVEKNIVPQVQELIDKELESMITIEVDRLMKDLIPPGDIQGLEADREELRALRWELHNSESRLANSRLQARYLDDPLSTIVNSRGSPSKFFPRTFRELRNITDNAKGLLEFYEEKSSDADPNTDLNHLLIYFGLRYQVVGPKGILFKCDEHF